MRRIALIPLALMALSACAGTDVVDRLQPGGFLQDAPAIVQQTDWSDPDTVTVTLTDYAFTPNELTFHRDRATRLVLVNAAKQDHTFVASSFFPGIAVKQLVGPTQTLAGSWVEKVVVPEGQTKELWFVPARYGAYRFECTVTGHSSLGMNGIINVVQ
jgi:uncharacterized cupredoxin-like copper-binding protein